MSFLQLRSKYFNRPTSSPGGDPEVFVFDSVTITEDFAPDIVPRAVSVFDLVTVTDKSHPVGLARNFKNTHDSILS